MIDIGSSFTPQLKVYDQNGNLTNAGTISPVIVQPDGTMVGPTLSNPSTGLYTFTFVPSQAGRHVLTWVTTSPNTAYTDVFDVSPQPPIGIVSLADAKRQLGLDPGETEDDDELRSWIQAMTGPVELYKNEVIVQRQFTFTWQSRHGYKFRLFKLPVVQLLSLSGIIWGTTTTYVSTPIQAGSTTGAYFIDPDTGLGRQILAGPSLDGMLTATWTAGYSVIPQHYQNACMLLLQGLWETRRGPGGVGGIIGPEELQDYRHFEALPRKIREMLGPPRPVVI